MQTPIQQSQPYVSTAEGNQAVYQAFPAYQLSQCQMASSSRTPESSMPMYSPSPSQFVNQQRIPPMPPYSHLPSQDGFNGSTSFTELGHQFETMSLEANKRLAIQGSHYSQPTYTVNKNFPHNDLDYLTPQVAPSDQYSATGFTGQDTNLSQPNYPPRQVYPTIPPFVQSIQNASNPSYPSPHLPAQPPGLPSANRRLNADHMPSAIEVYYIIL
ncbi:unnamed protein product [Protopolystoma xenopodis]|uniref:Uncharacterized protein n=1 Tax=Protopolystoma xenopodis TaxID=117903 RepID=A0A3S5ATM1_9PLAT|nr:unnamed protein product [Protopolystoma xenopodis]